MKKEYFKPQIRIETIFESSCLLAGSDYDEVVNLEDKDGDFDQDENNYFVINAKKQNGSIWDEEW